NGKQTFNVFLVKGAEARSVEAVGKKIVADAEVSFWPQAQPRQGGRLHVLRRQPQRRFLFRFRRHQESVRHQGQAEFHRASPEWRVAVDWRRLQYRGQRLLDGGRIADERTGPEARSTHLGTMQRAEGWQADPRRSRGPSECQQLFQYRRHEGGIQRQRAGERSQALARSVRASDRAHGKLLG